MCSRMIVKFLKHALKAIFYFTYMYSGSTRVFYPFSNCTFFSALISKIAESIIHKTEIVKH